MANTEINEFRCIACRCVIEGPPTHIHFDGNELRLWCGPCYDNMTYPPSNRTFNKENDEAVKLFETHHRKLIQNDLKGGSDATFYKQTGNIIDGWPEHAHYISMNFADNLYMCDNPDGWVFFFRVIEANEDETPNVMYVPYQEVFRALELYLLKNCSNIHAARAAFRLYRNFENADDRYAHDPE